MSTPEAQAEKAAPAAPNVESGNAPVNGLQMYYEIHGQGGVPLVLLHGGISTIEVDFGLMLPGLSRSRQVIATEQQAHGHTADIDRPISFEQMAADTADLLRHLNVGQADFFGYSVGGEIALQLAIRQPELVRKLVIATPSYNREGEHPEMSGGMEGLTAEMMVGSPFHDSYLRVAPNPDDFPKLVERIKELDRGYVGWTAEDVRVVAAPTMLIVGDSDIVRPEHVVEMFRLRGGGVAGDLAGLPAARLAILPGTTHITLVHRADWLVPMITEFLDTPTPEAQ